MNILLISPLLTGRKPVVHNIGLSYIGGVLLKNGYNVSLLDIEAYKYSNKEVIEYLKINNPEIICIGTIITGFNYVKFLCDEIKKIYPDVPIILGNNIATTIPKIVLENINVDFLVVGEGEITIIDLIETLQNRGNLSNVKGIAYIKNDKIIITEPRELIQDLDSIPFPAWHLFPLKEIYFKNRSSKLTSPIGFISTTRGCPYKCTFCYHQFQNKKIRMHSAQRVIDEIKYLIENYNIKSLGFTDDLFIIKKSRVYEICDLMDKENIKLKWRVACRVDLINEDLLKRMKASGCVELGIGVEPGSQTILNNIKKQTTVQHAEKALSLCKKYKVNARTSYMIGNVGETKDTVYKTIEFRKKYDPGLGGFFYATPYPDLYRYALSNNLIKDELALIKSYGEQSEKILVNLTDMSNKELADLKSEANKILIMDYFKQYPIKGGYYIGKAIINKIINHT